MAVGVLALQGSFREHIACLRKLGVEAMEVRKPEQLEGLAGLIIPGGESTTMAKLAEHYHLVSHNLTLKSNFPLVCKIQNPSIRATPPVFSL
jgi:glutamine amidotransferase PdxT